MGEMGCITCKATVALLSPRKARRKSEENFGMVSGKYNPPSGACPVMVAVRKSTSGDW